MSEVGGFLRSFREGCYVGMFVYSTVSWSLISILYTHFISMFFLVFSIFII